MRPLSSSQPDPLPPSPQPLGPPPYLLLVAHGSPAPETTQEFSQLARHWQKLRPEMSISTAFLSVGEPTIPQALDSLSSLGATRIWVQPLLVFTGKHLLADLPRMVAEFADSHPGIALEIGPPLGSWVDFPQYLAKSLPMPPSS